MNIRTFTLAIGVIYFLVGVSGFIPGLMKPPAPDAPTLSTPYSMLLGMFAVNSMHNIVHLAFGVWGILAYKDIDDARLFSRSLAITYGVLGVFGLIPNLNTLFGMVPLFGHDVWLHFLTAAAAAYFGFVSPAMAGMGHAEREAGKSHRVS
jgi:hypothetical protein